MNKDFVEVVNDSGSNNGSFNVVCKQNSGNERSTILTVSGRGITKSIICNQTAGVPNVIIGGVKGLITKIIISR